MYRLTNQWREIAKERAEADKAAARAINILRERLPDTFLGRKTQEPFPKEKDKDTPAQT